jgi:hypothetical protein
VCQKWQNAVVPGAGWQNVIQTNAAPFVDAQGTHLMNYDYNCGDYRNRPTNANYDKYCTAAANNDAAWTP